MRIPYPTRIAPLHSAAFALLLCTVQLIEGTPLYFSAATFLFIFIATLAFNAAGGLSRPSGGYVFFYALLTVIVGLVVKAVLGEAADTNLFNPQTTMLVYVGGISAMYVAVLAAHRLTPKKALLDGLGSPEGWGAASLGCIIIGLAITIWSNFYGSEGSSSGVLTIVRQINRFLPLGIILGTMHTIRSSGGRRLLSLPVIVAVLSMILFYGIEGSSKQGYFEPLVCVALAAMASKYNFSFRQLALVALGVFISVVYVVPYIQLAKAIQADLPGKINFTIEYFTNTGGAAQERVAHELIPYEDYNDFVIHYYNEPQGFADRLEMLAIDDALIDVTDQGHVYGIYPTVFAFLNIIPHFIWPGKPDFHAGNVFWHEIGYNHYQRNGEEDDTTGISMSPTSDAYHEAKWYGVLLLAPALWFGAFFLLDWLCGDARKAPWGLLGILLTTHVAPEGMLAGAVFLMSFGFVGIYLVSFLAAYVLPSLAMLVLGPQATRVSRSPQTLRAATARSVPQLPGNTV